MPLFMNMDPNWRDLIFLTSTKKDADKSKEVPQGLRIAYLICWVSNVISQVAAAVFLWKARPHHQCDDDPPTYLWAVWLVCMIVTVFFGVSYLYMTLCHIVFNVWYERKLGDPHLYLMMRRRLFFGSLGGVSILCASFIYPLLDVVTECIDPDLRGYIIVTSWIAILCYVIPLGLHFVFIYCRCIPILNRVRRIPDPELGRPSMTTRENDVERGRLDGDSEAAECGAELLPTKPDAHTPPKTNEDGIRPEEQYHPTSCTYIRTTVIKIDETVLFTGMNP